MCLVSEDAYFQSNTSAIVFKAKSLDPDRKVRPRLELIAGEKSAFDRIADMRHFVRRRQRRDLLHRDRVQIHYTIVVESIIYS